MENEKSKKILLAVDASDNALEAIRYASKTNLFQEKEVVLFSVYSKTPEYYWDLEMNYPSDHQMMQEIKALEMQQEKTLQEFMQKARQILVDAEFPEKALTVNIHAREAGIARDIAKEAQRGYYAVVVGRKGMSELKDLVLGSISTKLLESLDFVPLLVVGENPQVGKVLVALDGSKGAMRAVDFVGDTLGGSDFEVLLVHVIRGEEKQYIAEAEKRIQNAFDAAHNRLVDSGFQPHLITKKAVTGALSRAGAILQEAKEGGYGTIVVGRRGLSRVQEFFMGRVSNKVIQLAKEHAVWVVS